MEEIKTPGRHPSITRHNPGFEELAQRAIVSLTPDQVASIVERDADDPRMLSAQQRLVWNLYINPKSKTFGNAYQSALVAGYRDSYAVNITTRPWWCEKVRRLNLLHKAEIVLEDMIEMPVMVTEWQRRGDDAEQVVVTSPALVKIKQDTAKFVAERLGKDEGYATRTEHTGAEGGPIQISPEKKAEADQAIKNFLEGNNE